MGAVTMTAIGAVDMALWDIAGKAANKPVYQLLGGASRDAVLVYCHANGATVEDTLHGGRRSSEAGLHARFARSARRRVSAMPTASPKAAIATNPPSAGLPRETHWSTEPYLQFAPVLFERLRREFGPEVDLLHDVHHRLRPIEAARLGKSLEPYHLFWMEDPGTGGTPGRVSDRSASTPRRRWPWAKSSTASMTAIA